MKIGIVTTWFERGAAIVSRQFKEALEMQGHEVFIYARGGEKFAKNDNRWNMPGVTWNSFLKSNIPTDIDEKQFKNWLSSTSVEAVLFNEQQFFEPVLWVKDHGIPAIAYIDYYTRDNVSTFRIYDQLWCNTNRHFEAFRWHCGARYIPWGTNTNVFKCTSENRPFMFFHSAGMNPSRKGADIFIRSLYECRSLMVEKGQKALVHTQVALKSFFPDLIQQISELQESKVLEIIEGTIPAPGLYGKGRVYIYPSRLEGIGLTLAEAAVSGLFVVTSREQPMSEFCLDSLSATIKISHRYTRSDNYYWDMVEPDVKHLTEIMSELLDGTLPSHNIIAEAASSKFDFNKNASCLSDFLTSIHVNTVEEGDKILINQNDKSIGVLFKGRGILQRLVFAVLSRIKSLFK